MKKTSLLFCTILCASLNLFSQKVANQLNNSAYKTAATVNGVNTTLGAATTASETAKGLGKMLGLGTGKAKLKKEARQATVEAGPVASGDLATSGNVSKVAFDKIDYMQLKAMKDELSQNKQIKDIKITSGAEGNFLTIQHETDIDKILDVILSKWSDKYEIASTGAEGAVFKHK